MFQWNDGTYGFESERWASEDQRWIPFPHAAGCRTASPEAALVEAAERIAWLAEERTGGDEYRVSTTDRSAVPESVNGLPIVCYTWIDQRHRPTGNTRHVVHGSLLSLPAGLAICRDEGGSFFLYHCDLEWQPMTDTWHQTLDEAKTQAEFEFEGASQTWELP